MTTTLLVNYLAMVVLTLLPFFVESIQVTSIMAGVFIVYLALFEIIMILVA